MLGQATTTVLEGILTHTLLKAQVITLLLDCLRWGLSKDPLLYLEVQQCLLPSILPMASVMALRVRQTAPRLPVRSTAEK